MPSNYNDSKLLTTAWTSNIESYWNRVILKLKRMRGTNRNMLPGYFDEFMWRERSFQSVSFVSLWFPHTWFHYLCCTRREEYAPPPRKDRLRGGLITIIIYPKSSGLVCIKTWVNFQLVILTIKWHQKC